MQQQNGIAKTMMMTTSDPPSPKQEGPHLAVEEALSEEESSTPQLPEDPRRESLSDGVSEARVVKPERPQTARSMSSIRRKLVKQQKPQVQFDKSVNPLWGWTRIGSSRSTASTGSV